MHYFKTKDLSINEAKKKLVASVLPRPVGMVLSQSEEGIINIAPFSYFNIVTYNPPIVAFSFQRVNGQSKDTARNILTTKEATVHIVTEHIIEEANKTSAPLGPDESELDLTNFTLDESRDIKVPGIKEALVRYETKLYQHSVIYNHDNEATADLILLEVLSYHIDDSVYNEDKDYILADKLAPVARLAGNDYSKLGETFTLKRPEKGKNE